MSKVYTVAILGCGNRGSVYAFGMSRQPDRYKVVSICDVNPVQAENMNRKLNLKKEAIFTDTNEFLKEKRADVLAIATWDTDHVEQCLRAMDLGYDILLEKPVSDSSEEIKLLMEKQKETGRKIVVCHVMRYAPAILLLDEIVKTGVLGKLMAIDHTERVTYWHYIQAYIKLHTVWQGKIHPTILAKCCHDLDLIQHFANSKCHSVTSVGKVGCFLKENAPEGATEFCLDCKNVETCPYSAKRIYVDKWKASGCPEFNWPYNRVSQKFPTTEEDLYEGLRTTVYGKCPYLLDIDSDPHVADHQLVQMQFQNGVVANLKMIFSASSGRRIVLYGEKGEIVMDQRTDTVEIMPYGQPKEIKKISEYAPTNGGHGGGDTGIINTFYDILTDKCTEYTSLEESLESHLIGIAAEESRLNDSKCVIIR